MRDAKSADPRLTVYDMGFRLRPVPEGDLRRSTAEVVVYAYTSDPDDRTARVRRALRRAIALRKKAQAAAEKSCHAETFP